MYSSTLRWYRPVKIKKMSFPILQWQSDWDSFVHWGVNHLKRNGKSEYMWSYWIHHTAVVVWSLSMAAPGLMHPRRRVGLPLWNLQLSAAKPQMGPFTLSGCEPCLRGGGEGDLVALLLSNFCYGKLLLICSIWILGKRTIWEVYHNSSLDKQLNEEWKICILREGTTEKYSHMAMISSVFTKGLAQESSPVDTDQIYHCGNVTWLVWCLNCESAEQRDVALQHVQYLSSPFPLAGTDFVFNVTEEWFS